MKQHPIIERYFPLMPTHKLEELAGDLRLNQQKFPIIRYETMILDGNNRYHAMRMLGWKHEQMKFTDFKGTDKQALLYAFSLNYHRRHQSSSDLRTMMELLLSAKDKELAPIGRPKKDAPVITHKELAQAAGVSVSTVQRQLRNDKESKSPDRVLDPFGHEIKGEALAYWKRMDEVKLFVKIAQKLAQEIKKLNKSDPMWATLPSLQSLEAKANAIAHDFKSSMPYCVCPTCMGIEPENCRFCFHRGLVTKHLYDTGYPKEAKKSFERPPEDGVKPA